MRFRGEQISRIEGAPPERWELEDFLSDWRENITEHDPDFSNFKPVVESILKPVHDEYEDLLDLITTADDLSADQRNSMLMRLNHALAHVAEYGIRDISHILKSIANQKYTQDRHTMADFFNPIIDMLAKKLKEITG